MFASQGLKFFKALAPLTVSYFLMRWELFFNLQGEETEAQKVSIPR